MKKKLFSILLVTGLISVSTISYAHDARVSLGLEVGIPMGTFGDNQGIGFGGSLRYEAPLGDNAAITATAGYLTFGGKDFTESGITIKGESTYMIPIQAGLKYYFMEQQQGFYGHVMLGVHMYKSSETTYDLTTGVTTTKDKLKAAFSYAPEIGYHLDNLDFGLRYQLFAISSPVVNLATGEVTSESKSYGYLGLRVAYVFGGQ